MLACICDILALIDKSFKELAQIIRCIADIVFLMMSGCMIAQVRNEKEYQKTKKGNGNTSYNPPVATASKM